MYKKTFIRIFFVVITIPNTIFVQAMNPPLIPFTSNDIPQMPDCDNLCYMNAAIQVLYNNIVINPLALKIQSPTSSTLVNAYLNLINKLYHRTATQADIQAIVKEFYKTEESKYTPEQIRQKVSNILGTSNKQIENEVILAAKQPSGQAAMDSVQSSVILGQLARKNYEQWRNITDYLKEKFHMGEQDPVEFIRPLIDNLTKISDPFRNSITLEFLPDPYQQSSSTKKTETTPIWELTISEGGSLPNIFFNNLNYITDKQKKVSKSISSALSVIIIHLNNLNEKKITIPPTIDIKAFMFFKSLEETVYELTEAIIYLASGPQEAGHYEAIIKKSNQWYECENNRIKLISEKVALEKAGKATFLFFTKQSYISSYKSVPPTKDLPPLQQNPITTPTHPSQSQYFAPQAPFSISNQLNQLTQTLQRLKQRVSNS